MKRSSWIATVAVAGVNSFLLSSPAIATFHFWEINEIYSNEDGTVQYIELFTTFNTQQFTAGQTIRASQGASSNDFVFPGNTPAPTSGHHLLLATADFVSLPGAVTPDFIFADGFLFGPDGIVNFIGANSLTYDCLPTDGTSSLHCVSNNGSSCTAASIAANSPTNYAGDTGSIDAGGSGCTDGDCDGFGSPGDAACPGGAAQDCDDTDGSVFPGAPETPDDGIDQDCNGFDTVTCFVDGDNDGFGTAATVLSDDGDCLDAGESEVDTDCDDTDDSINPGAPEVCAGGVDEDCDGLADAADPDCRIPTVSQWGLATMTLLLLVAATLCIRRRPIGLK